MQQFNQRESFWGLLQKASIDSIHGSWWYRGYLGTKSSTYYIEIFYYKNDNYGEIIQNTKNAMLPGLVEIQWHSKVLDTLHFSSYLKLECEILPNIPPV